MPATSKWQQLADHIRTQITTGELQPGDKLPSTAQLKAQHSVSEMVIRYAMHALKQEGLVYSVHGLGVFVSEKPTEG
ncbi:winged helix-turn-helix domain-containing protein [Micromonospora sp. NPDC049679]|uniref:winged helix-turn-helix domain-containing protein n=1 Tax=Micromonospora sp. NPDC049679 TaxID=3155920 RepID=UPI0033E33C9C